jgi:hypothetical protein
MTANPYEVKNCGSLTELLSELPSPLNQQALIEVILILQLLAQPTEYKFV